MLHVRKSSASSRFTQWSFSKVDVPNLVNYLDQTPILKGYVVRCGPTRNYILCLTNTHTKKQTNKQTMCLVKIGLHAQNMISILDLIDNAIDSPTTLGGPARHPTSPTCVGAYAKATRCPTGYKAPPPCSQPARAPPVGHMHLHWSPLATEGPAPAGLVGCLIGPPTWPGYEEDLYDH